MRDALERYARAPNHIGVRRKLPAPDSGPGDGTPAACYSDDIETVEIHHLGPRSHEVLDELLLRA
jgi:hypothetical protein